MESLGPLRLYVGPPRRGGTDSIAQTVVAAIAPQPAAGGAADPLPESTPDQPSATNRGGPGKVTAVSQQVSHPDVVNALAQARAAGTASSVTVLLERDYLFERSPVPPHEIWQAGGRSEANRSGLMALLRSAIPVRFDHLRGDLLHVNLLITGAGQPAAVLLTSANLSPGSLDRHLNWALAIDDANLAAACLEAVDQAWDGDFRDVALDEPIPDVGGRLVMDADGGPSRSFDDAVAAAQESVALAFFNLADGTAGAEALTAALGRGVTVTGVVDADQGNQRWDGVPALRQAGADIRYYPGARTGAVGRMHHKMAVIDGTVAYLSTANLSASALSSLELSAVIPDAGPLAARLVAETARLFTGASRRPIPEAPV